MYYLQPSRRGGTATRAVATNQKTSDPVLWAQASVIPGTPSHNELAPTSGQARPRAQDSPWDRCPHRRGTTGEHTWIACPPLRGRGSHAEQSTCIPHTTVEDGGASSVRSSQVPSKSIFPSILIPLSAHARAGWDRETVTDRPARQVLTLPAETASTHAWHWLSMAPCRGALALALPRTKPPSPTMLEFLPTRQQQSPPIRAHTPSKHAASKFWQRRL
ncbi:hypothetical protein C8Q78DRAFT_315060 [Trametes maxima]|nr:hypothetical protein C8Q78DRAFT_315060 [Trametes maxima]